MMEDDLASWGLQGDALSRVCTMNVVGPNIMSDIFGSATTSTLTFLTILDGAKQKEEEKVKQEDDDDDLHLHFTQSQSVTTKNLTDDLLANFVNEGVIQHQQQKSHEILLNEAFQEFLMTEPMSPISNSPFEKKVEASPRKKRQLSLSLCESISIAPCMPLRPLKLFRHDPVRDFVLRLSKMQDAHDVFNLLGHFFLNFVFF